MYADMSNYISRIERTSYGQILYLDVQAFNRKGFWANLKKKITGCDEVDLKEMDRVIKWFHQNPSNLFVRLDPQEYYLCVGDRHGTMWEPNCG